MDGVFYTAAILRERADLRTRRPTRIQLQRLAAQYDGRPVRSIGIVSQVESIRGESGGEHVLIRARDQETGEEVLYQVSAGPSAEAPAALGRSPFDRWTKGQTVIVEGTLRWQDAEAVPVVVVGSIRYD